jgi:pimeloyl-ACP methyl ester carboxylesterase
VTLAREYAAKNRVDLRALELDVVSDARWYAKRANSHKVEVSGASHAVYVSRPKEVAALIEEAAARARHDLNARDKGANP